MGELTQVVHDKIKSLTGKNTPIIVSSGLHDKEVVDYIMQIGAKAFLAKPVNPQDLTNTLREYL